MKSKSNTIDHSPMISERVDEINNRLKELEEKHKKFSHNTRNGLMVLKQMINSDQELLKGMDKRINQIWEVMENNNNAS